MMSSSDSRLQRFAQCNTAQKWKDALERVPVGGIECELFEMISPDHIYLLISDSRFERHIPYAFKKALADDDLAKAEAIAYRTRLTSDMVYSIVLHRKLTLFEEVSKYGAFTNVITKEIIDEIFSNLDALATRTMAIVMFRDRAITKTYHMRVVALMKMYLEKPHPSVEIQEEYSRYIVHYGGVIITRSVEPETPPPTQGERITMLEQEVSSMRQMLEKISSMLEKL